MKKVVEGAFYLRIRTSRRHKSLQQVAHVGLFLHDMTDKLRERNIGCKRNDRRGALVIICFVWKATCYGVEPTRFGPAGRCGGSVLAKHLFSGDSGDFRMYQVSLLLLERHEKNRRMRFLNAIYERGPHTVVERCMQPAQLK